MSLVLLSPGRGPQPIASVDDDLALTQQGPAVIIDTFEAVSLTEATVSPTTELPPHGRPVAFREAGDEWKEVGFEAADHWEQMTDELRGRLVEDHLATLDVAEFKTATNGGSASIITNNWVHSGSPRVYRVAGALRDFVTVLGELNRA